MFYTLFLILPNRTFGQHRRVAARIPKVHDINHITIDAIHQFVQMSEHNAPMFTRHTLQQWFHRPQPGIIA